MDSGIENTLSKFANTTNLVWCIQRDLESNPKYKYRLGRDSRPEDKDLEMLVDKKLAMSLPCTYSAESQTNFGLHHKHGQQAKGRNSDPLLCSVETLSGVLSPALGPST